MKIAARISTLLAALALPACAIAGDIAQINVLGFSKDAGVFAYEEYGVQDGSGFPYSNIYFIDTQKDAYLPGTPYRVTITDYDDGEEELVPVSKARKQAAEAASGLMEKYEIADNPGIFGAFNSQSQLGVPGNELSYRIVQTDPPFGGTYTLKLETISFPRPANCEGFPGDYGGFKLRFTESNGETSDIAAYADDHVPASRGCVGSYRLSGVALTGENHGPHMALIEVHTFGFEGYDGRWIAVPVRP